MKKVVISFAIPEPLKHGMTKHCKKTGESRSAFVSNAISRALGDWKQEKINNKNCHTFEVFCDSVLIGAVLHGAEKMNCDPEQFIRHCIFFESYNR